MRWAHMHGESTLGSGTPTPDTGYCVREEQGRFTVPRRGKGSGCFAACCVRGERAPAACRVWRVERRGPYRR